MSNQSSLHIEEQFIGRLKTHEKAAFSELYDRYGGALYGVVLRVVEDEGAARDVLQETFVKVWKNIDSYSAKKGRFFTWMLNIARNSAIDHRRSKGFRQQQATEDVDAATSVGQSSINVNAMDLGDFVKKLQPDYQQVIEWVYFKGYTHAEAAEHLALPLGTVKTRVKIGLRELRSMMNER